SRGEGRRKGRVRLRQAGGRFSHVRGQTRARRRRRDVVPWEPPGMEWYDLDLDYRANGRPHDLKIRPWRLEVDDRLLRNLQFDVGQSHVPPQALRGERQT